MVNSLELDAVFGALSSAPRRLMITMLRDKPRTLTDLCAPLGISLPATHKHLMVLEKAKLISRTKVGREQHITLVPTAFTNAEAWIEYHQTYWNAQLDEIDAYIAQKNSKA